MNIFKIQYDWYEGDYEETLLIKDTEIEQFEQDLIEAKTFAQNLIGIKIKERSYLGKGYVVECLPEYYEQIVWFLTKRLGYIIGYFDKRISYHVDEFGLDKISVEKHENIIRRNAL